MISKKSLGWIWKYMGDIYIKEGAAIKVIFPEHTKFESIESSALDNTVIKYGQTQLNFMHKGEVLSFVPAFVYVEVDAMTIVPRTQRQKENFKKFTSKL